MKSSKEIEVLIEKYYNGETSLEEEQQLQAFFLGEVVPDHLKSYQEQFRHISVSGQLEWPEFTEEKLFGKLDAHLAEEAAPKVIQMPKQKASAELWFYRVAAAVALVLVGYFAGRPGDKGQLDPELLKLKEILAAQIEGSSASGRMQAVSYSLQVPESQVDDEVVNVLIDVTLQDKNMNVRMKGVEALTRLGNNQKVRKALIGALESEEEPAVKLSLIEALVTLGESGALDNLQKIADDEETLKDVRDEARLGIFRLSEM